MKLQELVHKKDSIPIPSTAAGKIVSIFLLLVFFLLPFQPKILRHLFKQFSVASIPDHLLLPQFFSKTIAFFPTDLVLLTLTGTILVIYRKKWKEVLWAGPSKFLTLLALIMLLSIGCSISSHYPLQYLQWFQFAMMAMFFHGLRISLSREHCTSFIRAVAWLMCVLGLVECLIGCSQFFLQHEVGLKWLGEKSMKYCTFPLPSGERWIFDRLFHVKTEMTHIKRICGTVANPNVLGGFLFCSLLSSTYLFFTSGNKRCRWFLGGSIVFQIMTLLLSFSRAALLATLLSMTIWFYLQWRAKVRVKKTLILFLASIMVCGAVFYPSLASRGGIFNYNSQTEEADTERMIYHRIAWKMLKENPVLGVGYNNFQLHTSRFAPSDWPLLHSKVHNIYLLIAAETGILGITCFLLFLLAILREAVKNLYSSETMFLFSVVCGLLVIGCCDFYLVQSAFGQGLFLGMTALLYSSRRPVDHCHHS